MKHIRLSLTADGREREIHPVYDKLVNAEYIEYATAMNWNFTGEELAILHYIEGDRDRFEAAITELSVVTASDFEQIDSERFYVYIRDQTTPTMQRVFRAFTDDSIVVAPPVEYTAGAMTMSLFGAAERIQAAIDTVPEYVSISVEQISGLQTVPGSEPALLSDRQREAVETAVSLGYYDVPRTASHEDVAAAMECALSTAAEHLRKAESNVLSSIFGTDGSS